MNKLCKTFAAALSSLSTEKRLLPPIFILQSSLCSTTSCTEQANIPRSKTKNKNKTKTEPSESKLENPGFPPPPPPPPAAAAKFTKKEITDWPRPSEIPFQVKVANSVSLIGSIAMPVQFESSPDGKSWAGTIITQGKTANFPAMWIPVIFEGDLAHVAACHLKENDLVHIAGQLSADTPPFTVEKGQANVQVMVQSVSFVQDSYIKKKRFAPPNHDAGGLSHGIMNDDISVQQSWNQLLVKPHEWLDKRLNKDNQTGAAFEHKESGKLLWIDESTPEWILSKLDSMTFAYETDEEKTQKSGIMNDISVKQSWNQLLAKPHDWLDKRSNKNNQTGLAFEHKESGKLLWIDESTPEWILSKLDSMTFSHETKEKSQKSGRDSTVSYWTKLVNHPERWRDYRKHKMNGKVKPGYPDFKCKEDGHALWLNTAPISLLPKLEGLEFDDEIADINLRKDDKIEESWKNLVENPDKWWDNRLDKRNKKAPDFKHKVTGEGLWIGSSPAWVLSKLPPPKAKNGLAVAGRDSLWSQAASET